MMRPKDEITVPITLSLANWSVILAAIEAAKIRTLGGTSEMNAIGYEIERAITKHSVKSRMTLTAETLRRREASK